MGFLFKGVCYPTSQEAKSAACSASNAIWGSGDSVLSVDCTSTDFSMNSMDLCKRVDGGSCVSFTQDYPIFQQCDFDGSNSVPVDWMYASLGIFAVLVSFKRLIELFSSGDRE